jgi:hypothetical protein
MSSAYSNNPWAAYMSAGRSPSANGLYHQQQYDRQGDEAIRLAQQTPSGSGELQTDGQFLDAPPAYGDVYPASSPNVPAQSLHPSDEKARLAPISASPLPRSRSPSPSGQHEVLQQALEFTQHPPPAYAFQAPRLRRPVAVPQVSSRPGMPYARAYAPILAEHGVNLEEFVEFIDNLNIVSSSSSPLQILDLAGGVIDMVPISHAQLIRLGIQTVAKVGNVAVMKTRGSMFLKKANSDFFDPRGLKVELATGEAMRAKLGLDPNAPLAAPISESGQLTAIERKLLGWRAISSPATA